LRAWYVHQGIRLGTTLTHPWLGAIRPILYAMIGNRAQHHLDDTLPSGRRRLTQLAVKRFEGLARPVQAHLARQHPLTQRRL